MNPVEQFGNRVIEAILGSIFTLLFAVFAKIFTQVNRAMNTDPGNPSTSVEFLIGVYSAAPTFFDLMAIIVATLTGGPIGFIGATLEIAGGNALLANGSGIELILIGAFFVVIGSLIWSWSGFFRLFQSNQRSKW